MLRLGNSAWDLFCFFFWGGGGGNFLAQGVFWVLIFVTIRSSPSLEFRGTPPGFGCSIKVGP